MVTIAYTSPFGQEQDLFFMRQALAQAQRAFVSGEVPIGAIIVNQSSKIIAQGYNQVEQQYTQAAHAEMVALKHAGRTHKDWRLNTCWLYVTLEPCSMCIAAIRLSRCAGIVYAARSPLFGYSLDNELESHVYKKDALIQVEGVLADESIELLKTFFHKKREKE